MRPPLTARQREVLDYIGRFTTEAGYPPTVREIGAHFDFVPGSVSDHLKALQRKGYLRRDPAKSRTLQILAPPSAVRPSLVRTAARKLVASVRNRPKGYAPKPKTIRAVNEAPASRATKRVEYSNLRSDDSRAAAASNTDSDSVVQEQLRLYLQNQRTENATSQARKGIKSSAGSPQSSSYEPLASTWDADDAELLERMLDFYPREEPGRILDATINGGRFWRGSKRPIIGMDVEAKHRPNLVGDNSCMPFQNQAFEVVVYDPPHIPNQGRDKSKDFNIRFGLVLRSAKENGYSFAHTYPPFLREAYRVLKPEGILFCKISDYIHDHRYQWAHVDLIQAAREAGFFPCDCIIKIRKGPIIDPRWKTAHHTRRQHCYWLVFRKSDKCE